MLQTALKSFARNQNIKKVGHEEVRNYYNYKSAKCPDDTSRKVAEFTNKVQLVILQKL
ncbi:hypothetical protein C2G38_2227200 [Gigaspora rosea]|uniref:Uncharacterized protein n=1 Tax=Gigaspora rosea TaxID=44941 RepID=A0A397U0X1_9GLOM|nr:hypothetical protein C2G38_2227200 [Gigaspora rosea]